MYYLNLFCESVKDTINDTYDNENMENINDEDDRYKKIKFSTIVNVVIIPPRSYYITYNLLNELFYTYENIEQFRNDSSNEIKELICRNIGMTFIDAKKLLYQPHNITYDPENFNI